MKVLAILISMLLVVPAFVGTAIIGLLFAFLKFYSNLEDFFVACLTEEKQS